MSNEFDDAVTAAMQPAPGQAARMGFSVAADTNPDAYAEAQRVARRTGVPVDTVFSMPSEMKRQAAVGSIDFDTLAQTSPATAALLADVEKARIAHDSVDNMTGLESALSSLGAAAKYLVSAPGQQNTLLGDIGAGIHQANRGAAGLFQLGFELPAPLLDPLVGSVLPENPLRRAAAGFSDLGEQSKAAAMRLSPPQPGLVAGGVSSGVQSLTSNLLMLPMAFLPGGQAAALGGMAGQTGGQAYQDARAQGMTPTQSLPFAASQAAIEYATEKIPLVRLLGDIGAGSSLGKTLARQIAAEVPGEQIATVLQDLNEWAVLPENRDKPFSDYLEARPGAAVQTLIATVIGVGGNVAVMRGIDSAITTADQKAQRAQAAQQQAEQLAQLTELAAASKVLQRDPETFEAFVAQAAEAGTVQQVFIAADALMQSGMAEQVAAVSPAVASQLEVAAATGGQVAIPVEEFAARIAPTEAASVLLDHLKTDPEGFSRAEAQQYMQAHADELQAEVARTLDAQQGGDAFKQSAEEVRTAVRTQLDDAARFTPEVNAAYSSMVGNFYAVQAAKLGITPDAMFQRYPLRVVAESVAGERFDQEPVASQIKGDEFSASDDVKELRLAAKDWYDKNLRDTAVVNADSGREVKFAGSRKAISTSANPVKIRLFAALRELVQNGKIVNSQAPKKPVAGESTRAYHWLEGTVLLNGERVRVGVTLREDSSGNLYYNHNPINEAPDNIQGGDPANKAGVYKDASGAYEQSLELGDSGVNLTLLQGRDTARGSFSPESNTIALLKGADLSTFLHESGHFFLEVQADMALQPDAPQIVAQDMQTVLSWFGVPDMATWQAMDLEQKRPHHEQFARGFEAYLFDGKAPGIEMQGVFQRFRAWLLNIYRDLKALNVELTDDVRGVFDRMLATGEQIQLAEQGRSMLPLFATAEQGGMTAEEFAAYQALGTDATNDAIQDLQARGLRDMQWLHNARGREIKRLQQEAKAKRAEVRQLVAEEVNAEPVYRAWELLKRAGSEDAPAVRLSRAALADMYGGATEGAFDRYALLDWKRLGDQRMTAEDGLHPDLVAETIANEDGAPAFSSGDELVRQLVAAPKPSDEIEARTDARMLEQFGELVSPEAIEKAADQAIHNDARARFVAAEANALARATGQRKILLDAAREFAKATIARLRVRDVRPGQYANAEVKAARNAESAMKAQDLRTAAAEKRNQVIQQQLTRAAYSAQEDVGKAVRYLKKFDSPGVRKNLDVDYLDQIDSMLERFDLRQRSDTERARAASLRTWVQSRLNEGEVPDFAEALLSPAERARYEAAVQSRDANGELIYADDEEAIKLLADAIDNSAQRHYRDLTVEELLGLQETVSGIEHLARLKHRLLTAADNRDYESVRDEIAAGITTHARASGKNTRTASSLSGRALEAVRAFGAEHIKASTWARIMDGGQDDGPVWRYLVRPANDAANRETQMKAELVQQLDTIMRPILKTVPAGDKIGKGRYFESIGDSLNWQERFAVALNVGNESNLQRLLDGRGWTMGQVQPVLQSLTAQELQAAQAVWDLFETYRPAVAEQERRIRGKEPQWVAARPITIQSADGQEVRLRGGYYPVKFDPRVNLQAGQHSAAEDAKTKTKAAYGVATTRRSFTKARVEEVKGRPLMLNLQGMYSGFGDVIHSLAWQEWVIDANKLLRSKTIDTAIREHYGPEVKHELGRWRDDIVVGSARQNTAAEQVVNFMRQNVSAAALSFQVFTAAMQPLGMVNSVARVGGSWIAKGVGRYIGAPITSTREAMAKSAFLANRTRTRFRELNELRNQVQGQTSAKEFMGRWGYWLMVRTQLAVDIPTWWGAYEKAMADGRSEDTAVALADQAVKDAQGGGETVDQAGIERGNAYHKLFTAFYSYMGSTLNTMYSSAKVDSKGKAAANILLMVTVPAVLQSLLKQAMTPGDDDWDKWLMSLPAEVASFMAGLVVFVRELAPLAKSLSGEGAMGYGGPAGLRMIGDVLRLGQQAGQGEFDTGFRKAFISVLGDLTGLPSVQINRTVDGAEAMADGKTDNPAALAFGFQEKR
ncbi:MAG: hypothetical protein LBV14_13295 [Acidovorax sp.]|nr:hypothetical protein [Acidovorax sp.]